MPAPKQSAFVAPQTISRTTFKPLLPSSLSSVTYVPLRQPYTRVMQKRTLQKGNPGRHTIESRVSTIEPKQIPKDAIPYFAYFANMNPNKIGPLSRSSSRRCKIFHSQKALLPSYDIVFDVPGIPPEPVFANITESSSSTVHGILHWLSPPDFDRIARSEGVFRNSQINLLGPLVSLASIKDVEVDTMARDGSASTIKAKTIVFNYSIPGFLRSRLCPSRRYLQVAVEGAKYWGINKDYISKLRAIPTERGLLGGFGLLVEPRPHLLDRPNSYEQFGKPSSEIYSPWRPIRSTAAVEAIERDSHSTKGKDLRLLRVSNTTRNSASERKPLYYIPGIDGTGKGILSQVGDLDEEGIYDVSTFVFPFANRQTLQELAEEVIGMIKADAGEKPITIVGESMGGVISLLLAIENERRLREASSLSCLNIDVLMLINPATSFRRSNPRALWDFLLSLGFSEEMYALLLPPVLLPFIIDFDSMRNKFGPEIFPRLRELLFSLTELSRVLPQDALTWRLKLLSEFSIGKEELKPLSGEFGPSRIALISSINDNLIPSHSESYRLRRYIQNAYTMVLPFGGHVPSFDSRFSLSAYLKAFNDAPAKGNSKTITAPSPSVLKRRAAFRKRFPNIDDDGLDVKTREDLGRLRTFLKKFTETSSPVFVGEENIPEYDSNHPILFVCNHTLLGWLDAMYPVERILRERNVLVRSLAHPKLFEQTQQGQLSFPNTTRVTRADINDFGITQVGSRQLLEQLSSGKWSLLFPGGAKEALKENEKQKYSLKWPDKPEFIRACALFGAQIIPVSTVGSEDMVRIVASPKQVQEVLDAGSRLIGRPIDWKALSFEGVPRRDTMSGDGVPLIPPLMLPNGSDRLYFRFGKPIDVEEACLYDDKMEKQLYNKVRDSVSHGIEVLKRRRKLDEYRAEDRRREFLEKYGENADPPCGNAWLWRKNGSFLDEEKQPPLL